MRISVAIVIVIALLSSCSDTVEDNLYRSGDHIRFEFYEPGKTDPSDPVLDTFAIHVPQVAALTIPVVFSYAGTRTQPLTATLSVTSAEMTEGEAYTIETPDENPADKNIQFSTDATVANVLFTPISENIVPGFITLEIVSTSDPRVVLGYPGPRAIRKRFVIEIQP